MVVSGLHCWPEDKLPLRFHPWDAPVLTVLEEGSLTVTIREIREG